MTEILTAGKFVALFAGLICAVWSDCKKRKIPNRLTVSMAAVGLLLAALNGFGAAKQAALGLLFGLTLGVVFWLLHIIRAGDAKLLSAVGAMMGTRWLLNELTWALLSGLAVGVIILIRKREFHSRLCRVWDYFKGLLYSRRFSAYEPLKETEGELPFAIPMLLGAVIALLYRPW